MSSAIFCELSSAGLIAVRGADALSFLHAQVTRDIAGMESRQTGYSGYCSPKGRLLATFLVWRHDQQAMLQLPGDLRELIQSRLSKYVLRAKAELSDATRDHRLFGVYGEGAGEIIRTLIGAAPERPHELIVADDIWCARLPESRYLLMVGRNGNDTVRSALSSRAREEPESAWLRLDIEAGVPVITSAIQDQYVPQMVNLDLIGGVSYTKGCYPGQEIVARMHYLGRLKQRMYRIRLPVGDPPLTGESLYSAEFGAQQASGSIVSAVRDAGGFQALAVIQTSAASGGGIHWKSLDGPAVDFLPLPYTSA